MKIALDFILFDGVPYFSAADPSVWRTLYTNPDGKLVEAPDDATRVLVGVVEGCLSWLPQTWEQKAIEELGHQFVDRISAWDEADVIITGIELPPMPPRCNWEGYRPISDNGEAPAAHGYLIAQRKRTT